MRFLKFSKRDNEIERCLCLWTPWITIVWDFGSTICMGTDEFELVIKYRAWGPILYFGNRDIEKLGERRKFDRLQFRKVQPRYSEQRKKRISDRDFYEAREHEIRLGKRKSPANMTYAERHAETMKAVRKMKFSNNFVHLMTTPYAKLALERGEECKDDVTGELLTEEMFARDKEKNLRIAPKNYGLLGFTKAKDADGYEAIHVPGFFPPSIESGDNKNLQLEEGK